jgi:hypothetical protein
MPPDKAKEQLERSQLDQERRSQRRGYRGPSLGTEQRIATLGLMSEGIDPDQFDTRKQWDMAVNERMTTEREARGPMAFSTAEGRLVPMQQEAPSPLTQTPNLRFPATQGAGGELGMDRERLNQTAMNEAMRLGGGQITDESRAQVIQTPYGVMSTSAPVGQQEFETSTAGFQGFERPERYAMTPTGGFQRQLSGEEDRSLAMAGMAEKGAAIRSSLEEQGQQRYAAFRQGLEERRAQEALDPSRNFGTVGRAATMRGAQAMVEAERWKQTQEGRDPMSREPLKAFGLEFDRGSMGQYSPRASFNNWQTGVVSGGPQPTETAQPATAQTPTSPMRRNIMGEAPKPFGETAYSAPTPDFGGVFSGTDFSSRIESPFSRLRMATGQPERRRRPIARGPLPYGMRA